MMDTQGDHDGALQCLAANTDHEGLTCTSAQRDTGAGSGSNHEGGSPAEGYGTGAHMAAGCWAPSAQPCR